MPPADFSQNPPPSLSPSLSPQPRAGDGPEGRESAGPERRSAATGAEATGAGEPVASRQPAAPPPAVAAPATAAPPSAAGHPAPPPAASPPAPPGTASPAAPPSAASPSTAAPPTDDLAAAIAAGNRRALARGITLIESTRPDHRERAVALLAALPARQALRIGLSGTPGVGKSTFVEAFGLMLTGLGLRVAVIAVDPSSARSGGSILGDKTRMERLSRDPRAYIRPSPSQAELGGVGRRTRESVRLCEAAGHDVVLIETVGVGQSETLVADMCDLFVLLLAPAGGDELQGVKRGIMEMADLVLVNKADGDLRPAALRTVADYAGALRLLRRRPQDPDGFPKALPVSATLAEGLTAAWAEMQALAGWRRAHGHFAARRAEQAQGWFLAEVRAGLLARLSSREASERLARLGAEVAAGGRDPVAAAAEMLAGLA